MTLESIAQLLATTLLLLQAVSANPALPQSVRDQTQGVAQRVITEATRAMARPSVSVVSVGASTQPSCTIRSDKDNYELGEIIVFRWSARNATSATFVPAASDKNLVPPTLDLGGGGEWRAPAAVRGYPFVTIKASNGSESATCSRMVYVY